MHLGSNRAAVIAAFALAVSAPAAGGQVVTYNFEVDPVFQGWYFSSQNGWTTAQASSPTHSLQIDGIVGTPFIGNPDGQFMAADFSTYQASPAASTAEFAFGFQPLKSGPGWQANTFTFKARGNPTGDRLNFWGTGYYVDDLTLRPITRAQAATIQDANFAYFMPGPVTFTPAADRFARIPNAINRLAAGQPLSVMMFGDSIVHDTYSSSFEPLVERRYPGAQLSVHEAVANGAGASYWVQNNRIRDQVMASNPNLVVFGGISYVNEIPLISEVIRQVRQVNPSAEILLLSPIAGDFDNPYLDPTLAQPFDPVHGTDYRAMLYRLAQQEGVQFWDLTTPWASYILNSGLQYSHFLRDTIHMNGFGNMLAGRIVDAYFAPVPEPGTLALTAAAAALGLALRRLQRSRRP
jgi:hypothetical protein